MSLRRLPPVANASDRPERRRPGASTFIDSSGADEALAADDDEEEEEEEEADEEEDDEDDEASAARANTSAIPGALMTAGSAWQSRVS